MDRRMQYRLLAFAGVAAPIVFTGLVIAQGLLRPEHSHMADPTSALASGSSGWVQDVNFVVVGLLISAYAIGLHLGVSPGRGGMVGPALLVSSGLGLVGAGIFPARDASGTFSQDQIEHFVAAFIAFFGAGSGLIVMSRRMAGDPRWRSVAVYTLVTGIATIALFVAFGALARSPEAPLHSWGGVVQRVNVAVWFGCTIVHALNLLRISAVPGVSSSGSTYVSQPR